MGVGRRLLFLQTVFFFNYFIILILFIFIFLAMPYETCGLLVPGSGPEPATPSGGSMEQSLQTMSEGYECYISDKPFQPYSAQTCAKVRYRQS